MVATARKLSGRPYIERPPVSTRPRPRIAMKVASVTMNALMRKRITRTPLNAPASAPKAIPIRSVSQGASSSPDAEPRLAASHAASMALNAMTDSTDRSMCPAMMQNDRPIAMMPTKVACCRMLMKMPIWKKRSMLSDSAIRRIARISHTR